MKLMTDIRNRDLAAAGFFNLDEWLQRGALMRRVALDPIAERVRPAVNELSRGLLVARDALSETAATTFEWCSDLFDRLSANWSLLWSEPPPTPATIPTPTLPIEETGRADAADARSCEIAPIDGPTDRSPCMSTRR